jgi:hypothetical protein
MLTLQAPLLMLCCVQGMSGLSRKQLMVIAIPLAGLLLLLACVAVARTAKNRRLKLWSQFSGCDRDQPVCCTCCCIGREPRHGGTGSLKMGKSAVHPEPKARRRQSSVARAQDHILRLSPRRRGVVWNHSARTFVTTALAAVKSNTASCTRAFKLSMSESTSSYAVCP